MITFICLTLVKRLTKLKSHTRARSPLYLCISLSLIFAIFKQHPAPFCVLDEVDAPLDDANVARFTSLIHELADDLQFIFISHIKLTMQIADELKGITMPSAGISTLVSVSLDEAARYVES